MKHAWHRHTLAHSPCFVAIERLSMYATSPASTLSNLRCQAAESPTTGGDQSSNSESWLSEIQTKDHRLLRLCQHPQNSERREQSPRQGDVNDTLCSIPISVPFLKWIPAATERKSITKDGDVQQGDLYLPPLDIAPSKIVRYEVRRRRLNYVSI